MTYKNSKKYFVLLVTSLLIILIWDLQIFVLYLVDNIILPDSNPLTTLYHLLLLQIISYNTFCCFISLSSFLTFSIYLFWARFIIVWSLCSKLSTFWRACSQKLTLVYRYNLNSFMVCCVENLALWGVQVVGEYLTKRVASKKRTAFSIYVEIVTLVSILHLTLILNWPCEIYLKEGLVRSSNIIHEYIIAFAATN